MRCKSYDLNSLSSVLNEICEKDCVEQLEGRSIEEQKEVAEKQLSNKIIEKLPFGSYLKRSMDAKWPKELPEEWEDGQIEEFAKQLAQAVFPPKSEGSTIETATKSILGNLKAKRDLCDRIAYLPNRVHVLYVMRAMHILLGSNPERIISSIPANDDVSRKLRQIVTEQVFGVQGIVYKAGRDNVERNIEEIKQLLMVLALYHDIGKSIALERHPYEGYHLIVDLGAILRREDGATELDSLRRMLCPEASISRSETLFRLFTRPILYHDSFGPLSNGEAAFPMLIDAIELQVREPARHKELLSYLLLANLADIDGAMRDFSRVESHGMGGLTKEKVRLLLDDWEEICSIIDGGKERDEIVQEFFKRSQDQTKVIKRIDRLLEASGGSCGLDKINDILHYVCGGGLQQFCRNFGASKLDYALRFAQRLQKRKRDFLFAVGQEIMSQLESDRSMKGGLKNSFEENGIVFSGKVTISFRKFDSSQDYVISDGNNRYVIRNEGDKWNAYRQRLSDEDVAHIVISLLNRVVNTYAGFIQQTQQQERVPGFELLWLTREDSVCDSIIDTFIDNPDRAVSWCEDEITVFPTR